MVSDYYFSRPDVFSVIHANEHRITDPYESLVFGILGQLLVGGPASPFYETLIDADIGSDFSPATG